MTFRKREASYINQSLTPSLPHSSQQTQTLIPLLPNPSLVANRKNEKEVAPTKVKKAKVKEVAEKPAIAPSKAKAKEVAPSMVESEDPRKKAKTNAKVVAEKPAGSKAADAESESSEDDSDSDSGKEKAADELESSEDNSDESDSELWKKKTTVAPPALDEYDSDESESKSESEPARDVNNVAAKATYSKLESSEDEFDLESGKKKAADAPAVKVTPKAKRALMLNEEPLPELNEEKDEKPDRFKRLWCDKDEILLLQGMLDFKDDKKVDPMLNYIEFYAYVKDSLDVDFDQAQVTRKIRSLLGRYKTYLNWKKNYLKAHEQYTINLSKLVWGPTLKKPATTSSSKKRTRATIAPALALNGKEWEDLEEDDDKKSWNFVDRLHILLGMKEVVVNEALKKIDSAEKAMIEETWKQFFLDEASLFARKLEVVKANTTQINDIMKKKK